MNPSTHDDAATDTHIEQIKQHLLSGAPITKKEAWQMYRCWNSGDVIHKLRHRHNMPIEKDMIKEGKSRFARYYLKKAEKEA